MVMTSRRETGSYPRRRSWADVSSHLDDRWRPGEHFSVIAPTGYGKSHLVTRGLLPLWEWVLTLDVKDDDETIRRHAGRTVRHFPSRFELLGAGDETHFRLAPRKDHRLVFDDAMRQAWRSGRERKADGAWTIYVDETRIMSDKMGMKAHLEEMWIRGRSRGITIIGGTQAPRYVPTEFYDQASWLAFGRVRDRRAMMRLSEIGGDVDQDMLRDQLPRLDRSRHEFLILGPDDYSAITTAPA